MADIDQNDEMTHFRNPENFKFTQTDDVSESDYLLSLSDKDRKKLRDMKETLGLIAPRDDGILGEFSDSFNQSLIGGLKGIGATANELGLGSGMQEYFEGVERRNQQWNRPEHLGVTGYIGRGIGTGVGSTAVIAPAMVADAFLPTKGALTFSAVMAQTLGENVQYNRKVYGDNEKAWALALCESAVDAGIETALGTVPMVGKSLKGMSYAGKRAIVQEMIRRGKKELGRSAFNRFVRGMVTNAAEEGAEEGLQYLNTLFWRTVGGDPNVEFDGDEMTENMAMGAIGGAALGVIGGGRDASVFTRKDGSIRPWVPGAKEFLAEQAENDARVIEEKNIAQYLVPNEDGSLFTKENMPFVNRFIQETGAENMMTSDGLPTSELETRIQRSLLGVFAMKTQNGRELLKNLIEKQEALGIKKIVRGVMQSAGNVIRVANEKPAYDMRHDIGVALARLVKFRQEMAKNNIKSVEDFKSQSTLNLGDDFKEEEVTPTAETLFEFFASAKSIKQCYEYINELCGVADTQDFNTPDMFGAEPMTKQELLRQTERKIDERNGQSADAGESDAGGSAQNVHASGENGDVLETHQPEQRTAGQENAGGVGSNAANEEEISRPRPAGRVEEKSAADAYDGIRKTKEATNGRVKEFLALPDEEHTLGGISFTKNGNVFVRDGQKLSARGIEKSFRGVDISKSNSAPSKKPHSGAEIKDFGEKIEGARKDIAVKIGKRNGRKTAEIDGDIPAWRKKYFAMDDRDGKWDLYVKDPSYAFGNARPVTRQQFATEEEALKNIPAAYIAEHYRFRQVDKGGEWGLYRLNKSAHRFTMLKDGFSSQEEAMKFALDHVDELSSIRTTKGEKDILIKPDYERTGERRMNRDVTPEDFGKAFGFRGVQFGNWENQDERQQILNDAYEALYDLADLLNIPPQAISLNGELAAAFGARGHGGNARAHYESDQIVINLTKPSGAGTFAHEWFHALDNYFHKQAQKETGHDHHYLSEDTYNRNGMREELFKKFEVLKKAIKNSERPKTEHEIEVAKEINKKSRARLEEEFRKLRDDLANASNKIYSHRKIKNATTEQLDEFDRLVNAIMAEDAPPVTWKGIASNRTKYGANYRYTNDLFEKLNDLYKSIVGRSGFDSKNYNSGALGGLATQRAYLAINEKRVNSNVEEGTRFFQDAKKLDRDRSGDYWSKDVELFARAFSAFIEDKLKEQGRKSEYLSYGSDNQFYDWGGVSPFPGGEERTRINQAFQDFFDEMKHEEDKKGNVRLYSLKRKREISNMDPDEFSAEQKKQILDAYNYAMNGEPVARLSGREFQKDGTPLTEKVTRFYQEQYNGNAVHPEIGKVKLDLEGVKDSLGHGIGSVKAAAYAAVPQMIEKGKIFDRQKNWKGRGYDTVVMIAPLEIGGVPYVGEVVVKQGIERQGFYLHEVEVKEKLADVFKTANGSTSPASKLIISQLVEKINSKSEKNQDFSSEPLSGDMNEGAEDTKQYSLKRHKQVNPVVENGDVKDLHQERIETFYETKSNDTLNRQAERRIAGIGGIDATIRAMLDGDFAVGSDVSQRVLQTVLNSENFKKLPVDQQVKISDLYIKAGTEAGRNLAARRLGVIDLDDLKSIQAHVNAFAAKIAKIKPKKDLRKSIMDEFGIDIYDLPENIVNNPELLDKLLRRMASERAGIFDKAYEFWINSILSGLPTHAANTLGNTANAVYELGLKRLAEALINVVARRKDGATFGEFKQLFHAVNWRDAGRRAKIAFNQEILSPSGKLEQARAAIGGKAGRVIRIPGRLLRAADEFAKAVIQPMEAAAFAYREGVAGGLSGNNLKKYIADQLKEKNSNANMWGRERALELTFQEDPGKAVSQLINWRESGGIFGVVLKLMLPFIKTPANVMRQGVRKSVVGSLNLAWETGKALAGKRKFDGKYVSLVAEQLLAWGAFAMFAGMGDDDDMPFITGTSSPYGSAEQRFKENKVPPYSIRIGDNYYSYKRIEPLATGLAFMADGLQAFRAAQNGEDGTRIMKKLMRGTIQLVVEKSFLDSLGELNRIASDPERDALKFITNFAASWMPNVVRQTVNVFDDNVRDNKSRSRGEQWWEDQFTIITNSMGLTKAAPKIDYFGREITKDSLADAGPLWQMMRLVPIKSVSPDDNMNRAERLMWNFNQSHPEAEYYPDVPAYYCVRNGKKLYFDGEYYNELAEKSGKLALKQINNAFRHGLLNETHPSQKDIDLIKKIFSRARKEVRDEMINRRHYSE